MSKVKVKFILHSLKDIILFSDCSINADLTQGVSYALEKWILINLCDVLCFFFDYISEGFRLDYFNTCTML